MVLPLIALLLPLATLAATSPIQDDWDLYLMDIRSGDHLLAESVVSYQSGEALFIHFASFLKAVEFPIEQRDRTWSGWFRIQESRFLWRMSTGEVRLAGASALDVKDAQWLDSDEGVFVSIEVLESWFSLDLTPNTRLQTIALFSSEPLPFQQRDARALARDRYRPGEHPRVDVTVPDQYRWATLPLFDASSNYRIQNEADGTRSSSAQTVLTAGMDLLKHSVLYTGSAGDTGEAGRQRLTIERIAPTRDGTLFAGVDRYVLGDIFGKNSNIVNGGGSGSGFNIERRRAAYGSSSNLVTITGNATPGWEAELYRNDVLITFGLVDADGRYVFPDQETVYGENIFEVRLFGPQGQTREDRHTYWGGGIELATGDYSFSFSHIDFSERFLDGERTDVNALGSDRTTDLRAAWALTSNLQLGAGYTWAGLGSRAADGTFTDAEYATLDGRMNLGRGLLLAEVVHQQAQGNAWAVRYLTSLNRHNINLSHQTFGDFESPYTVRSTKLDAQNQMTLSGPLSLAGLNSYTLRFTHQDRADGLTDYRIFNRIGARWGPVTLSNDLEYFRITGGNKFYLGRLRISGRRRQLSFRGQVDYDPDDAHPLNQVSGAVRWNVNRRIYNTTTIAKALKNDRILRVDNTLSMRVGALNLSVTVNASSDDSWAVALGINSRFGYDRESTGFITAERSLAHTGRATLNLFVDSNNNGVRESGESPVEWAAYKDQEVSAAAPGMMKLTGVPAGNPIQIQTRHFRFDDPFLSPRSTAYELYTHAGSDISVDIPVVVTGDVEGNLFTGEGSDGRNVSGVEIILSTLDGEQVAVTRSEFDGYFSFHGIPVGEYKVVVIPYPGGPGYNLKQFSLETEDGYKRLDPMYVW